MKPLLPINKSYLLLERSFMKPSHCPPGWLRVPVPIKNSQKQEVEILCKRLLKPLNLSSKIKGEIAEDFIKPLYSVLLLWGLKPKVIVVFLPLEKLDGCCWFVQSPHYVSDLVRELIVLLALKLCISHKWSAVFLNECLFKY